MRLVVVMFVVGATVLAASPMTKWEQDQAAGNAWAVSVGESPSRRPPVIEFVRRQQAPASVFDPIVLRAAGRRLIVSVAFLLFAAVIAMTGFGAPDEDARSGP